MPNLDVLFRSYRLNALNLPDRVVMAPMTRSRSPGGVPTSEVAGYYRRRAENGIGLIITEGTGVGRPASLNEPDMPRFYGLSVKPVGLGRIGVELVLERLRQHHGNLHHLLLGQRT
jgi:2,4-dienoyl-CoA reductase-like NADH-dependent reductase (Old Yellow Enzyme family)